MNKATIQEIVTMTAAAQDKYEKYYSLLKSNCFESKNRSKRHRGRELVPFLLCVETDKRTKR